MSLCTMSWRWRQLRVSMIWNITFLMSASDFRPAFRRPPALTNYITNHPVLFLISIQSAQYLMTLGCFNRFIIKKFDLRPGRCQSSKEKDLTANSSPVAFLLHLRTTPLVPSPSFSRNSYFYSKSSQDSTDSPLSFSGDQLAESESDFSLVFLLLWESRFRLRTRFC